jgi:GTP-binding protein
MKIRNASYAGTVHDNRESLCQVAFAGRSNAGKSSLINALLGRKSLVQTSKQPGKTRNVNYFLIEPVEITPFYMVDMPGYGYAKIARSMKSEWDGLARRYFNGNTNLKLLVIVMDIRRGVEDEERMLLGLASKMGCRSIIAATKADKVNTSERNRLVAGLQISAEAIGVSSVSRLGIDKLWHSIVEALEISQV